MRNHPKTFHIRFTEKEYEKLCKYAAKARLPKSTYIRHMINGTQPREAPPMEYFEFMRKIYELSSTFGQLNARAKHFDWVESEQLQATLDNFHNLMREIMSRLYWVENIDVKEALRHGKELAAEDVQESPVA